MEVAILRHAFERNVKGLPSLGLRWRTIIDYAINSVKENSRISRAVDSVTSVINPSLCHGAGYGRNIANTMNTDAEGRKLENCPS
jgi:hypothetical protein